MRLAVVSSTSRRRLLSVVVFGTCLVVESANGSNINSSRVQDEQNSLNILDKREINVIDDGKATRDLNIEEDDEHRSLWNVEPLIIPIEKPDLCETGPLKGYRCHHIPPPASFELWFCPRRTGQNSYSMDYVLDLLAQDDYLINQVGDGNYLIPEGKVATACTCGSVIVTPNPQNGGSPSNKFVGIPIPSQAFLLEEDCNAMCGRGKDDSCSLCAQTQFHTNGGQRELVPKCVHRSEVAYVPPGTRLFINEYCKLRGACQAETRENPFVNEVCF